MWDIDIKNFTVSHLDHKACSLKSGLDNFELTSLTVTIPCSPIYLFHVDRVAERLGDGVGERVAGKEDKFCRKIKRFRNVTNITNSHGERVQLRFCRLVPWCFHLLGNLEKDVSHPLEVFARPVGLAHKPLHALRTRPHPILSPPAKRPLAFISCHVWPMQSTHRRNLVRRWMNFQWHTWTLRRWHGSKCRGQRCCQRSRAHLQPLAQSARVLKIIPLSLRKTLTKYKPGI